MADHGNDTGHKGSHKSTVTRKKAKKILRDGKVRGKKLTKRQKGLFGARAGGAPVKKEKRGK